jgi:hypothetical protein
MIYEYALVSSEPIELWAATCDVHNDQEFRRRNAVIMN